MVSFLHTTNQLHVPIVRNSVKGWCVPKQICLLGTSVLPEADGMWGPERRQIHSLRGGRLLSACSLMQHRRGCRHLEHSRNGSQCLRTE